VITPTTLIHLLTGTPARALGKKADPPARPVFSRPRTRHEADEIAEPAQPQAVLQILSGADVQTALPQEYVAPVHGAGAGQAGDRVDDVQYRPPGADRHQVLDALQPGPQ